MATLLRVRTAIAGPQGGDMLNTLYFRSFLRVRAPR